MAGDLMGLTGMAGAAGAGDAIAQLFDQRMRAAADARAQAEHQALLAFRERQLAQQDATHRLAIQGRIDQLAQNEKDRQAVIQARKATNAEKVYGNLTSTTDISGQQMEDLSTALGPGATSLFRPQGFAPQEPPAALAAPDQSAVPVLSGTITNSPSPTAMIFHRIQTPAEEQRTTGLKTLAGLFPTSGTAGNPMDPNNPAHRLALAEAMKTAGLTGSPAEVLGPVKDPNAAEQRLEDRKALIDYANASRPQANSYQLQPETDPATGKQTGRFLGYNTKTNRWEPIEGEGPAATKGAPGAAQVAIQTKYEHDAIDSLNQLDQSIDAAKDLIGPAAGRGETVEQWIGTADPKIQAFGTKLLLTKFRVDHAATGTARAGQSPALLARWDNLLANKVSYEGLKAAVQAAKEILGGTDSASAPGEWIDLGNGLKVRKK